MSKRNYKHLRQYDSILLGYDWEAVGISKDFINNDIRKLGHALQKFITLIGSNYI